GEAGSVRTRCRYGAKAWRPRPRHCEPGIGKRQFMAGDAYTIADMSVFAYSHVAADAGFDLSRRRYLQAWFERVKSQQGFDGAVIPYSSDPYSAQKLPFAV